MTYAIMNVPANCPEILTTPSGPYFIVQCINNTHLLSALHAYSDTLSVSRGSKVTIKIIHLCLIIVLSGSYYEYQSNTNVYL